MMWTGERHAVRPVHSTTGQRKAGTGRAEDEEEPPHDCPSGRRRECPDEAQNDPGVGAPVAGDRWCETGHVFTSTIGTPLDDCNVTPSVPAHPEDRRTAPASLPRPAAYLRHAADRARRPPALVMLSIQREAASKMDEILSRVDVRVAVKEGLEQVQ